MAKGIGFEVGAIPDETLRSDPDRLGRAFAAVLDNAVTFTERGKVRVDASIERREGNVPYLTLTVADTGPGILPEDQGRIFSPFVQLASPYTKRGGAGIGLSLARNIVRALGGEVRLQSDVGRGSVFTHPRACGRSPGQAGTGQRPIERRAYRLLVVDDNEVNLEYMAAILANAGHRAVTAASGAEALRLLEEAPPDAAILDIQMPGMSGIELGRKIRDYAGDRYDPTLPLVALTAFDPEEVRALASILTGSSTSPWTYPSSFPTWTRPWMRARRLRTSVFAEYWAGRTAEGARSLAAALQDIPGLATKIRAAIDADDAEA